MSARVVSKWRNILVLIALAGGSTQGIAGPVYKWVDAWGQTHYGEAPPQAELSSLEVIEIPEPGALRVTPPPDYRSALEVADRLRAARLERERLRREREEQARRARQELQQAPSQHPVDPVYRYYPPYVRHYNPGYGPPVTRHRPRYPHPPHTRWQAPPAPQAPRARVYIDQE